MAIELEGMQKLANSSAGKQTKRAIFEQLVLRRLCVALRHREQADHSILIYHLTDAEVGEAIAGGPAEFFPTSQVRGGK